MMRCHVHDNFGCTSGFRISRLKSINPINLIRLKIKYIVVILFCILIPLSPLDTYLFDLIIDLKNLITYRFLQSIPIISPSPDQLLSIYWCQVTSSNLSKTLKSLLIVHLSTLRLKKKKQPFLLDLQSKHSNFSRSSCQTNSITAKNLKRFMKAS